MAEEEAAEPLQGPNRPASTGRDVGVWWISSRVKCRGGGAARPISTGRDVEVVWISSKVWYCVIK